MSKKQNDVEPLTADEETQVTETLDADDPFAYEKPLDPNLGVIAPDDPVQAQLDKYMKADASTFQDEDSDFIPEGTYNGKIAGFKCVKKPGEYNLWIMRWQLEALDTPSTFYTTKFYKLVPIDEEKSHKTFGAMLSHIKRILSWNPELEDLYASDVRKLLPMTGVPTLVGVEAQCQVSHFTGKNGKIFMNVVPLMKS